MKNIAIILTSILFLGFASCSQQAEPTEETTVEKTPVTANAEVNLEIDGMTCVMGCKGAIEKSLNNTSGIAECAVDFDNSTAKITYDNNVIDEQGVLDAIHAVNNGAYSAKKVAETEATEVPSEEISTEV